MSMEFLRGLYAPHEWREGSADEAELKCLAGLAGRPEITTIAEIGFNAGLSAHTFLDANPHAIVYSFDIGEHPYVRAAADHIAHAFPSRFVLTYGDSLFTVPEFRRHHPQTTFDLIFIDGGHAYDVARQDILNMRDLAHPGTVLVVDDIVPWRHWGIGPASAWADLVEEGVVTRDELWQEGRRVDGLVPSGDRAWVVGRYVQQTGRHRAVGAPDPVKRARHLVSADAERNLDDPPSMFLLAETYFQLGDFATARTWFARRAAAGGVDEERHVSMVRLAESMAELGESWPDIQDAYLQAWEVRPSRAEPLYVIARRHREEGRYRLGYFFARDAAEIRAADEQAVCASWIGKKPEAFTLWRRILARPDLPDAERQHIAANRDVCVPTMLAAAETYPETLVASLAAGEPDVVVTVTAGPDLTSTALTLNSFLTCCTDVTRVGRFHAVDAGLTADDRDTLSQRYPFLQFTPPPASARFQLHLGCGWRFFAPENLITRLTAVLHAEPDIHQVGINLDDATTLTARSAPDDTVRRTPEAGRYVLADIRTDTPARGPAMVDTTRPDRTGTATLDEVLCITAG